MEKYPIIEPSPDFVRRIFDLDRTIKMNEYRISKYNPQFRTSSKYLKEEWTDFSDIGKTFNGVILTEQEYVSVEDKYIFCLIDILKQANIDALTITDFECYDDLPWRKGQSVSVKIIPDIIRACLRNKCWCKLEKRGAYIHFGYDFYVYVGNHLPYVSVKKICENYNLFCDRLMSPYH